MPSSLGSLQWILEETEKRVRPDLKVVVPVEPVINREPVSSPIPIGDILRERNILRARVEEARSNNLRPESMDDQERRPATGAVQGRGSGLQNVSEFPSLPVHRPMVDPVVDLKQETAREYNFAPQATEGLYQTPVHVYRISEQPKPEYGDWSGLYWGSEDKPGGRIDVWSHPRDPIKSVAPTLAHEYGHKWYSEDLSRNLRDQYLADIAGKQPAGFPAIFAREHPNEMYAEGVAAQGSPIYRGGYNVDASAMSRDPWLRYYPGLYNSPPALDLQSRGRRVQFEDGSWGWEYPDR